MLNDLHVAREYLSPQPDSFWRWQDDGEVVVLLDGTTLLFRQELIAILKGLEEEGLPDFNELLLLLAACRENWPTIRRGVAARLIPFEPIPLPRPPTAGHLGSLSNARSRLEQLDAVHELPSDVRGPVQAKVSLVQYTIESMSPVVVPPEITKIILALESGLPPEWLQQRGTPMTALSLVKHVGALRKQLLGISEEILRLRSKTGLDQLVQPAPIEMPLAEQVRRLLDEAIDDPELAGLARVARQLMATVHLPRALTDQDDAALGGVSDITNRGPLDRLLLSELANDDLTLTVRVAMNEALYLRREAPPRPPAQSRAVFIDTSIRMWGTPRVFAAGVALSLAATSDAKTEVNAFREAQRGVVSVNLATREGLIDQLAALSGSAHPGMVIDAFFRAAQKVSDTGDIVLVTGEDVLADPEFVQKLAACEQPSLYVAVVTRKGNFRLLWRSQRGTKLLREARLDLDELLAPLKPTRYPPKPLITGQDEDDLPLILSQQPFPLSLPIHVNPTRTWHIKPNGAISLTNDRRLMYWPRLDRGGVQLSDKMPAGKVHWSDCNEHGVTRAIVGSLAPRRLWLVRSEFASFDLTILPLEISVAPVLGVAVHDGFLYVISKTYLSLVDLETGKEVSHYPFLSDWGRWYGDRFFRNGMKWYVREFDGSDLTASLVFDGYKQTPKVPLAGMFRVIGRDGFVGLTADGDLLSTATGKVQKTNLNLATPLRVCAVARDGSRVVVASRNQPSRFRRISLHDGAVTTVYGDPRMAVEPQLIELFCQQNLRNRFLAIAATADGTLALITRLGFPIRIEWNAVSGGIRFENAREVPQNLRGRIPFTPVQGVPDTGYRLQRAMWKDGSRAFIDSRGMLHLISSRPYLPQLTLALSDSTHFAGWASNGWLFGPEYFTRGRENASAEQVFQHILREFVKFLP